MNGKGIALKLFYCKYIFFFFKVAQKVNLGRMKDVKQINKRMDMNKIRYIYIYIHMHIKLCLANARGSGHTVCEISPK